MLNKSYHKTEKCQGTDVLLRKIKALFFLEMGSTVPVKKSQAFPHNFSGIGPPAIDGKMVTNISKIQEEIP